MLRGNNSVRSGSDDETWSGDSNETSFTLDKLRAGEHVEVVSVDDDQVRLQTIRFGVCEGARISCVTKIPAGPVVVRHGRQEIAVGRKLASRISVKRCFERGESVN